MKIITVSLDDYDLPMIGQVVVQDSEVDAVVELFTREGIVVAVTGAETVADVLVEIERIMEDSDG